MFQRSQDSVLISDGGLASENARPGSRFVRRPFGRLLMDHPDEIIAVHSAFSNRFRHRHNGQLSSLP